MSEELMNSILLWYIQEHGIPHKWDDEIMEWLESIGEDAEGIIRWKYVG